VGEADAGIELGVAGELPVESGPADEDQADVAAFEVVAELLEAGGSEPVGFVEDDQFGAVLGVQLTHRG
jgi:hypothetical protein